MQSIRILFLSGCLLACSTQEREGQETGGAAGLGDAYMARRVTGVWLLSTDYHYQERCNYLPEEFVRNLFHLGDEVELTRYTELNSCELRWGPNKIGFYLESEKPFESVYQSEYYFNKLFDPKANQIADQQARAEPALSGPAPEGTNAETPASTTSSSQQDSTRGADPNSPIEGITKQTPPLVAPVQSPSAGEAVDRVGDKAIWEPGKKSLHVLYNNHVFSVVAQMPGSQAVLKQGSIGLARLVIESVNGNRDPRG
ncbi:hypothetical protein [Spirosoma aerolatum]|uniref:hypothetical protein n=1 Tax=Spirosoma aerolatum TaxID=1211326 RepID=UPI0009ADD0F0|nr:hypothetical protein [Spirosoma aerolatum]